MIRVKPEVPVARVGRDPGIIDCQSEIARERHPRPGEVERPAVTTGHDLDLVGIAEIRRAPERRGERRHRRFSADQPLQFADLPAAHQRLVRLHVDDAVGLHHAVGLRQPVRAARMSRGCHDHLEPAGPDRLAKQFMIHGEIQWKVRCLGRDTFRNPNQQRLSHDGVQQLSRKPCGFEPTGDDDGGGGHSPRCVTDGAARQRGSWFLGCKPGAGWSRFRPQSRTSWTKSKPFQAPSSTSESSSCRTRWAFMPGRPPWSCALRTNIAAMSSWKRTRNR